MQQSHTQLFDFAPGTYREAVLSGEMIKQKYSFSDFRHHVGYSLAMAGSSAEEIAYILGHSSVVTARHYIFSTPELAQIRAQALGKNSLYRQMIAMLLTGRLVYKQDWYQKKVLGNIGCKIYYDIGGCSYKDKSIIQELNLKKEEFECEITALKEEVEALHDFKRQFPDIQFKIEQLRQTKIHDYELLKIKIRAINSLIDYLCT